MKHPSKKRKPGVMLTVVQAADYLGIPETAVYRAIHDGRLRAFKVPYVRAQRVHRDTCDEFAARLKEQQS